MCDNFIKMIGNIDLLYGFIYECADLVNNLYNHNNYYCFAIKLYNKFILPMIDIIEYECTRKYDTKNIENICSYLMDICFDKLLRYEYEQIKIFTSNNIDNIESILASMHDFFDLYKKCYNNCCCIYEYGQDNIIQSKIIKSYFNEEYIKLFYLLQKNIDQIVSKKINLYNKNMSILINMYTSIYNNSNINCNEIVESKMYELYELYYNFSKYNKGQII